jgi:PIN domain nuclease of toxin-antitoxin system
MKVLLDTQCLLWMIAEPMRLGKKARVLLDAASTELYLSSASLFEIAVKFSLRKLVLPDHPHNYLPPILDRMGVREITVSSHHAYRVADLPWHHRDPFDRLLIAQSLVEKMPLITSDEQIFRYKNVHIDARK